LERTPLALRAERRLALARWPLILTVGAWLAATALPQVLGPWLGGQARTSSLVSDLAPLTLLALLLASGLLSLSARRRVLGETWGPLAYLNEQLRLLLAFLAGFLLLAFLPAIGLGLDAPWRWVLAPAAGLAASLWLWRHGSVVAWLMDAGPLQDPGQRAACADLLDSPDLRLDRRRATVSAIGHPDGGVVNAVAVAGLKDCRVFFTRRLLALLDPAETAAVCAHELAHMEWRNRRWLLRYRGVWLLLTVAGLAVPVLVARPPWWLTPGWMLALLVLLVLLQRRQRGEESACDARALALGADPAALASGLIKLYRATLMPRRLGAAADQSMTHPSLARRLQAIRRLAGMPEPEPEPNGPSPLWVASGTGWLRLDGESVQRHPQRDSDPDWRKPFASLIELCLIPSGPGAKLSLRATQGAAARLPLAPAEIPAVQAHLDRVDHRLAPLPERPLGVGRWAPWIALAILLASSADPARTLTLFQQLLVLILAVAVLVTRRGGALAVLAAVATGLALSLALEQGVAQTASLPAMLALGGAGLWGLWLLRAVRQRLAPGAAIALAAPCLALGAYAWLDAGLRPWDPTLATRLHALGDERASLFLPLLALAAVLGLSGRAARRWGMAVGLVAVLGIAAPAASLYPWWAAASGLDPLAGTPPPPPPPGEPASFAERPLPGHAFALRISPDGRQFMVNLETADTDGPWRWVLGGFDGPLIEALADAAAFADGRWLVVRRAADHSALSLLDPTGHGAPAWTLRLTALSRDTEVSLWAGDGEWSLEQWAEDEGPTALWRGRIGQPDWQVVPADSETAGPPAAACTKTTAATTPAPRPTPWRLAAETQGSATPGAWRPWRSGLLRRGSLVSAITLSGPDGARRGFATPGYVRCLAPAPPGRQLCLATRSDRRTRTLKVWTLDRRTGRLAPLVAVGSGFDSADGDHGDLLLFQPESPDGHLVWVNAQTAPLTREAPGAPLREVQIQARGLFGLRDTGTGTNLLRLVVPEVSGSDPQARADGPGSGAR
jgi:Zn-dependent protease with chaperone function